MRVVLIGGTGFTGPYIVRGLVEEGHAVTVVHRGQHPMDVAGVKEMRGEVGKLSECAARLRAGKADVVVHMQAMTCADAQEALEIFAGHAGRMVVASSQDVYAAFGGLLGKEAATPTAGIALTEGSPLRTSRYIHGGTYEKLEVEEVFGGAGSILPATILRMPAVYGPGDRRHRFYPHVRRMMEGRPAIILEAGGAHFRWSHAYVENVARAFVLAITRDEAAGRVYNISEEKTPSVGERVHAIAQAMGYRGKVIVAPRDRCPKHLQAPGDFRFDLILSDAAIRRELGYVETISAEEGFKRTCAWQRGVCPLTVDAETFNYPAEDAFLKSIGIDLPVSV